MVEVCAHVTRTKTARGGERGGFNTGQSWLTHAMIVCGCRLDFCVYIGFVKIFSDFNKKHTFIFMLPTDLLKFPLPSIVTKKNDIFNVPDTSNWIIRMNLYFSSIPTGHAKTGTHVNQALFHMCSVQGGSKIKYFYCFLLQCIWWRHVLLLLLKGHCLIFLSAIYQLFIEYFNIK